MTSFQKVADLDPPHLGPNGERFAVLAIYPTQRVGDGCRAIVVSLHHKRSDAERAATIPATGHAPTEGEG